MQGTYRCRCGANLIVYEGEKKILCGTCGTWHELPATYWQTGNEKKRPQIASSANYVVYVSYRYAISFIFVTIYKRSAPHRTDGINRFLWPVLYSLITLLLGWWGIPWGPIRTVQALYINLRGGQMVF
ncbi:MAG: hypothetical protein AB4368_08455 [Xenococcaceae cyanobacterium]